MAVPRPRYRRNRCPTLPAGQWCSARCSWPDADAQPVPRTTDQRVRRHAALRDYDETRPAVPTASTRHKTNGKNVLDKISIRPPRASYDYGAGNPNQWVGWRYIIQRDSDLEWRRSRISTRAASSRTRPTRRIRPSSAAAPGMPARTPRATIGCASSSAGTSGSSSVESGKVVHQFEYYRAIKGSSTKDRMNSCYRDWQGV